MKINDTIFLSFMKILSIRFPPKKSMWPHRLFQLTYKSFYVIIFIFALGGLFSFCYKRGVL